MTATFPKVEKLWILLGLEGRQRIRGIVLGLGQSGLPGVHLSTADRELDAR